MTTRDPGCPKSVEDAVNRILENMSADEKRWVRATKHQDLILYHFGWGADIRNSFGLWQGNEALLQPGIPTTAPRRLSTVEKLQASGEPRTNGAN